MPGRKASEERRREDILRAAYEVAARHGVEALTVRAVADRAKLSHGTVLFHFRRRDQLVATLLDRVIEATADLQADQLGAELVGTDRLHALLRLEMERLSADPRQFRLFLEYWTLGVRNPAIRRKVSVALERYRAAIETVAQPVTCADGIAGVAVSLIHGCALQAVIDPNGFDVQEHLEAARRMIEGAASPASRPASPQRSAAVSA